MNALGFNLFIVDEDPDALKGLTRYLNKRFGRLVNISTFGNNESVLKEVDKYTNVVVLNYDLTGSGNMALQAIKKINPGTEVIMLSGNEEIGEAIETYRNGASDFVVKRKNSWGRIAGDINRIIEYPMHALAKQFGISKYLAAFLLTFVAMGIIVIISLGIFR